MTFHLPPVLPPAQATVADLSAAATTGETLIELKGLQVHLLGCARIAPTLLRENLQTAETPSDIVLQLAQLLYQHHSVASRVDYLLDGTALYLICVPLRVATVTGTPGLQPFFADLRNSTAPQAGRVRADAVYAEIYSQRLALDSGFVLRDDGNNAVSVDLLAVPTGDPSGHIGADFSNAGNRFVGRNIVGASAQLHDDAATAYRAMFKHALAADAGIGADGDYDEAQASIGGVQRWGLWQLGVQGFRLKQTQPEATLRGRYLDGSASWTSLLYADWNSHSFLQLGARYASRASTLDPGDISVLREDYASVEPTLSYARFFGYERSAFTVDLASALVLGRLLGDTATTPAAQSVLQSRTALALEWRQSGRGTATLNLQAQYAPRRLPEVLQTVHGGPGALAAYVPGAVLGDSGVLGRLGWSALVVDELWFDVKLRVYLEYAAARFASSPAVSTPPDTRGADAGLGLTLNADRYLSLSIDYAEPLPGAQLNDDSRPGVYVSVSIRN